MKNFFYVSLLFLIVSCFFVSCLKDNDIYANDSGPTANADSDSDSDLDSDSNVEECEPDAETTTNCNSDGDVVTYDSCDEIINIEDCPDENGTCTVTSSGLTECGCANHFDFATNCASCLLGYGGANCLVCEIGYEGTYCDQCCDGYTKNANSKECEFSDFCGTDYLWLIDGDLPDVFRPNDNFTLSSSSSGPIITDLITKLQWRYCVEGQTWGNILGKDSCGAIPRHSIYTVFADSCNDEYGTSDPDNPWRKPTILEVSTLLHFDISSLEDTLMMNELYFSNTSNILWGTIQSDTIGATAKSLNFITGDSKSDFAAMQCVRGGHLETIPKRFVVASADGATVKDIWSNLEWSRCPAGQTWNQYFCDNIPLKSSYSNMKNVCDGVIAGKNDWRIANVVELKSLMNYCDDKRPYVSEVFTTLPAFSSFWTSTPSSDGDTNRQFAVNLTTHASDTRIKSESLYALCVRTNNQ